MRRQNPAMCLQWCNTMRCQKYSTLSYTCKGCSLLVKSTGSFLHTMYPALHPHLHPYLCPHLHPRLHLHLHLNLHPQLHPRLRPYLRPHLHLNLHPHLHPHLQPSRGIQRRAAPARCRSLHHSGAGAAQGRSEGLRGATEEAPGCRGRHIAAGHGGHVGVGGVLRHKVAITVTSPVTAPVTSNCNFTCNYNCKCTLAVTITTLDL